MPELHGSSTRLYANGLDISSLFREAEAGRERELVDTTAFGSTATKHTLAPAASGAVSASGMLEIDETTGVQVVKTMLDAAENNVSGNSIIVCMMRDTTIGDPGFALIGSTQDQRVSFPHTEVAKTTFSSNANRSLWVSSLHPLAARTSAHNSTALDNGASSAHGGVGVLTVTALSGTTPVLTAKLQHSVDNTTWVDVATFTSITSAAVAARYASHVVAAGTVNRYTRISVAVTSGSLTSVTFAAQFGRYTANK
jgi:hypothetical protein